MARVIIAATADADTQGILSDLAIKAGRRVAERYNARFDRLYDQLALFPASGAPRPLLGPAIRIGIILPYIVIYRHSLADDTVTVLRIVHGRRRISGSMVAENP